MATPSSSTLTLAARGIPLIIVNIDMDRQDELQVLRVWNVRKLKADYENFLLQKLFPEDPSVLAEVQKEAIAEEKKKFETFQFYYYNNAVHMDHDAPLAQCNVKPNSVLYYSKLIRLTLTAFINKHTWQLLTLEPDFRSIQELKKIVNEKMETTSDINLWDPSTIDLQCICNQLEFDDTEVIGKIEQEFGVSDDDVLGRENWKGLKLYFVDRKAEMVFNNELYSIRTVDMDGKITTLAQRKPAEFYKPDNFDGDWSDDFKRNEVDMDNEDDGDDDSSSTRSSTAG